MFIWAPVFIFTLIPNRLSPLLTHPTLKETVLFIREVVVYGVLTLAASLAADRLYFGFWTFPPYKWLYFNLSQSLAIFYGENPGHYYLTQGLPLLCTTLLPFVLLALWRSDPDPAVSQAFKVFRWAVYLTITILSQVSHKEARFIYPLLPLLHILAAKHVSHFFLWSPSHPSMPSQLHHKGYLAAGLLINLLLASYLSVAHQRAVISVLDFLRDQYATGDISTAPMTVGDNKPYVYFLTPCHSTPWRSHLVHPNLSVGALTCDPPLHTAPGTMERALYRDMADRFYDSPIGFLSHELWPVEAPSEDKAGAVGVPHFIVGFEGIEPVITEFFDGPGREHGVELKRVWEGWNGFFSEDWRRSGKLIVWETGV